MMFLFGIVLGRFEMMFCFGFIRLLFCLMFMVSVLFVCLSRSLVRFDFGWLQKMYIFLVCMMLLMFGVLMYQLGRLSCVLVIVFEVVGLLVWQVVIVFLQICMFFVIVVIFFCVLVFCQFWMFLRKIEVVSLRMVNSVQNICIGFFQVILEDFGLFIYGNVCQSCLL